jgi:hypothetical protein
MRVLRRMGFFASWRKVSVGMGYEDGNGGVGGSGSCFARMSHPSLRTKARWMGDLVSGARRAEADSLRE